MSQPGETKRSSWHEPFPERFRFSYQYRHDPEMCNPFESTLHFCGMRRDE